MNKKIIMSFLFIVAFLLSVNQAEAGYNGICGTADGATLDYNQTIASAGLTMCDQCGSPCISGSGSPAPGATAYYSCLGGGTPPGASDSCSVSKAYQCNTFFDCPKDSCKNVSCTNHVCVVGTNKTAGTSCSISPVKVCDGAGNCVAPSCSDSDGGTYPNTRGIATGIGSDGHAYTVKDQCAGEGTVIEQFCSGSTRYETWKACASGYKCIENASVVGACEIPVTHTCTDSDPYEDPLVKGSLVWDNDSPRYDVCSGDSVIQYYCNGTTNYDSISFNCKEAYGGSCVNGYCTGCSDSDGGNRPFYAGNTTFSPVPSGSSSPAYDHCNGNVLTEYYCNANGTLGISINNCNTYDANAICVSSGKCEIPKPTISLSVSKSFIALGDNFYLTYSTEGAVSCSFSTTSTGAGTSSSASSIPTSGCWDITPTSAGIKIYTFSCTNVSGTTINSTSIVVNYDGGDGGDNIAPIATINAVPESVDAEEPITFTGTGNDTDGTINSYGFYRGDCSSAFVLSTNPLDYIPKKSISIPFSFSFPADGSKTISFRVNDNSGATECVSKTVMVGGAGADLSCGTCEGTYNSSVTDWPICTFCGGEGTIVGDDPVFPENPGESILWDCAKDITKISCSAVRLPSPPSCTSKCLPENRANICKGVNIIDDCQVGVTCTGTKDCTWREVAP